MRLIGFAAAFALLAGPAWAIDGLHFGKIDPASGIDAIAATLADAQIFNSPKFPKIASGTDPEGRHVVVGGGQDDRVEIMAVSWKGAFASQDPADTADIEKAFGLTGLARTARDKCDPIYADASDMACMQVDYDCKGNWCPITLISLTPGEQKADGVTHLSWQAQP